jgi:hypothetical protein
MKLSALATVVLALAIALGFAGCVDGDGNDEADFSRAFTEV